MKQISTMEDTIRQAYQAPEIEVRIVKVRTSFLSNQIQDAEFDDEFNF